MKTQKILLVEDEAIIAAVESKTIRDFGYEVCVAYTGLDALKMAIEDDGIDLILMDIDLGKGIDGTEAARRILEKKSVPIVFLTSHSEREMVDRVRGITRYGYVIKNSGNFVLQSSIEMAFELFEAHEKMSESESRQRILVQTIPDLVWLKDVDGIYLACNHKFEKFFNAKEADIVGKTDYDFVDKEQADFFRDHDRIAMAAGAPSVNEEWVTYASDGHTVLLETIKTPMSGKDGRIIGVLGIARDITERKRAEEDRIANLKFLECLDRVNRAIQGAPDLEGMLNDVLETVLGIYDCDRIWLFYPCDPDAPTFRVPIEITKPEYPGAKVLNVDIPMTPDMAGNLREILVSDDPVTYTAGSERPINKVTAEQFGVQSQMAVLVAPKLDKPWVFGMHQCSYPRVWTAEERRLFKEIGRRLSDSLSSLLILRDLKGSEAKYRTLIQNIQAAVIVVELNTGTLTSNSLAQELFGMTEEQITSKRAFDLEWISFHGDGTVMPVGESPVNRVLATRKALRNVTVGIHRQKKENDVWVLVNADPVFGKDNEIEQVIVTFIDITDRKRAEEALQKKVIALSKPLDDPAGIQFTDLFNIEDIQRIQDEFAEATNVASIITRPDGTPITRQSNFCRLCNEIIRKTEKGLENCYKSDAVIGRQNPGGPIVQPCLSGGLWDAGASITVGGRHIANWLIGQIRNEELDERHMLEYADVIGADREEFKKALAEVPIMSKDQFKRVARALFSFANELSVKAYQNVQQARFITEIKRTEEALLEREVLFRSLADSGMALIWTSGIDKKCDYFNKSWLSFTGRSMEQELGDGWTEGVHPDDLERCIKVYSESFDRREPFSMDYRLRNRSDEYRWIQDDGMPRYNSKNSFIGYIGHCLDITERKNIEQKLLQSNREKEFLLKEMQHRMKNTLGIVSSLLSLEMDKIQDKNVHCFFQDSIARIQTISRIYEQLYKTDELNNIDLKKYVREMAQQLLDTYTMKPGLYQLSFMLDDVVLDMKRSMNIGLILNELLINVIKHAYPPDKNGAIRITLSKNEKNIVLSVSDDGKGFSADSRINKEPGMGLRIVELLAKEIGGSFHVVNEHGMTARLEIAV